jgi:hypothetical protein
MMAEQEDQDGQRPENWLLGSALTAITTIFAALGAVQLGMDRMLRNHPELVFAAFFFVILAAVLGGFALTLSSPITGRSPSSAVSSSAKSAGRRRVAGHLPTVKVFLGVPSNLIRLGLLCFAIAGLLAVWAAVVTPADNEFPSITAGFKVGDRSALTASVKTAGLTSDEDLDIHIFGISRQTRPTDTAESMSYITQERLYTTRLGPSPAGLVDMSVELPLSPGRFERMLIKAWVNTAPVCEAVAEEIIDKKSEPGCLVVVVPNLAERPQLSATWGKRGSQSETLSVKLTGGDMRVDKSIAVSIVGVMPRRSGPDRTLAQSVLAPNSHGKLDSSLEIPVSERFAEVCVSAIIVTPPDSPEDLKNLVALGCPPRAGKDTVWTTLRVPSRPFPG